MLEMTENHDATAANQPKCNARSRVADPGRRCVDAGEDVIVSGVNRDIPDGRGGHILEPLLVTASMTPSDCPRFAVRSADVT